MTPLAILAALLAILSLRLYLRNVRLVARLLRARSRCAKARDQLAAAERFAGITLVRSVKRRAALVRLARYCRETADTLDVSIEAGVDLATVTRMQIAARDAAIDALTARVAELTPRETSASIAAWQNETFGPATTDGQRVVDTRMRVLRAFEAVLNANLSRPRPNLSRAIRAAEELAELIELLVIDDNDPGAPREVADIDIVLRGIDAAHGVERATTVDAKMATNRARRWNLTGDGHGQHVEEPAP